MTQSTGLEGLLNMATDEMMIVLVDRTLKNHFTTILRANGDNDPSYIKFRDWGDVKVSTDVGELLSDLVSLGDDIGHPGEQSGQGHAQREAVTNMGNAVYELSRLLNLKDDVDRCEAIEKIEEACSNLKKEAQTKKYHPTT